MAFPLLLFIVLFGFFAEANNHPVGLGLAPYLQYPNEEESISGIRLMIIGEHRAMRGLDLGLFANLTNERFAGAAVAGLINGGAAETTIYGFQLAAVANINRTATVYGLQAAVYNQNKFDSYLVGVQIGLVNRAISVDGIQAGLVNSAEMYHGIQVGGANIASSVTGLQLGLTNLSQSSKKSPAVFRGVQFGLSNRADTIYGLQLGLLNMADDLHGIQIGIFNFAMNGLFVVFPVFNAGF